MRLLHAPQTFMLKLPCNDTMPGSSTETWTSGDCSGTNLLKLGSLADSVLQVRGV